MSSFPLPAAPGAPARGGHRHNFSFVKVVGLLNTYLPLTVIVFVINVKWFTAAAAVALITGGRRHGSRHSRH